jgi:hypothetical protein
MWAGSRLGNIQRTRNLDRVNHVLRAASTRAGVFSFILLISLFGPIFQAHALTGSEGFPASAPGGITSTLASITEGGSAITRTTPTACYAAWGSYGGFTGLSLHLYGVRSDITFTFSASENVTSFNFKAQAVNGVQSGRVNYSDGTNVSFSIPNTTALQTVTFTGNGNRISSFSIVGITGSSCNGDGTLSGGNDYWILDDISWTYTAYVPDTTPPTFPSSDTFSINENSTSVGTVQASESSTISIFDGPDKLKFSLSRITESTSALSFTTAPNFEAPTDADLNNSYIVVLRAVDTALNAGYETVTVNVLDMLDVATFNSLGLSSTSVSYRTTVTISANIALPSRITFLANGKRIGGCIKVSTSGSAPSIIATCTWRPSARGQVILTALSYPTNTNFSGATSSNLNIVVGTRTGSR